MRVSTYAYAAVAYLTTGAEYLPDGCPPGGSAPAVDVGAAGSVEATSLTGLMLLVMVTPPGWVFFGWYASRLPSPAPWPLPPAVPS